MSHQPAPTLLFAALRRLDSDKRSQLEDRCTELLATLMTNHPELADAFLDLYGFSANPADSGPSIETQYPAGGRDRVDLAFLRDVDSDSEENSFAWIEIKAWAPPGPGQFSRYLSEAKLRGIKFGVLCHRGAVGKKEADPPGVQVHSWDHLAAAFRKASDLPEWFDLAILTDPELDAIQADVAQFLIYLQQEDLIYMNKPVDRSTVEIAREGISAIENLWSLFSQASSEAGRKVFGARKDKDSDSYWLAEELNKIFKETALKGKRDGRSVLRLWTCFRPRDASSPWGIEFTLTSSDWIDAGGRAELGFAWGLRIESVSKEWNEGDLERRREWFSEAAEMAGSPQGEDLTYMEWWDRQYWIAFVPFSEVVDLDSGSAIGQLTRLTGEIETRMRVLADALRETKPDSEPDLHLETIAHR